MIYRFRVAYEEHEDIYRDIDIKASQTFNDLHYIIQQSISFDDSKSYSFYISDDYWRKEEEIPLGINPSEKEKKARTKKEESQKRKVIADYVNDPHQRFIYVFDPEKEWTFLIELIKIIPVENKAYPICIKSVGTSPKQYKETNLPPPPPEDDDEVVKILKDEKEIIIDPGEEKFSEDVDVDGLLPLKDEDVDTGEEKEEPGEEDEQGESSDESGFDDEEDR